jgi:soluble lytic murein transglycosylase-like protein
MKTQILLACILLSAANFAAAQVPAGYANVAAQYSIPPKLFYAIALQESSYPLGNKTTKPWPWTLNVNGVGYRYATREEAWRAAEKFMRSGTEQIDIGLMQINWRWNKALLKSSWQALDPYYNLHVAAYILHGHYSIQKDWWTAVGKYHSPGNHAKQRQRALKYRNRVQDRYRKLVASGAAP